MRKFLTALILLIACSCSNARVKEYKLEVVREYPHDVNAYTQGLFFHDGILCESTGQYGSSSYREVELESGKILRDIKFTAKYFGEGSCFFENQLYVLTWTNKIAFIYDPVTLKYKQGYSYPREGWGLTTDGTQLIASDGSSRLYFMDSKLQLIKTLDVTLDGRPVRYLNELEWIEGKIWANVYTTDTIMIIDPESGRVEARIDCSGLLPKKLHGPDTDVLNGIAVNPDNGRVYLTGKNWPRIYEIKLKD